MSDQELKDGVSDFLRGAGFSVTQIPEARHRTADLLAVKEQRYVIEIKTKDDDPRVTAAVQERLRRGEMAGSRSFPRTRCHESSRTELSR